MRALQAEFALLKTESTRLDAQLKAWYARTFPEQAPAMQASIFGAE